MWDSELCGWVRAEARAGLVQRGLGGKAAEPAPAGEECGRGAGSSDEKAQRKLLAWSEVLPLRTGD